MLHQLNLPRCVAELRWIVGLQGRLLAAVCQTHIISAVVTEAWVVSLVPRIPRPWVLRLCLCRDKVAGVNRPMLTHLRAIADFSITDKTTIIAAFTNDVGFHHAFATTPPSPPHKLQGVGALPEAAQATLRGFFESFYDPNFYKSLGYQRPQLAGGHRIFHRDIYLCEFQASNPKVSVCPLCDAAMEGPQVDHFYPKSKYPFLSCHPLNLLPICTTCNSRTHKGERLALTLAATDSKADWLHPYLRPAVGQYEVQFMHHIGGTTPSLSSSDPQTQTRLNNFQDLVHLTERWRTVLGRRIRLIKRRIDYHNQANGRAFSEAELLAKLAEWAAEAASGFGGEDHALLTAQYLRQAAARDPIFFTELWNYNIGGNPVSGA
jgi:hypothetical protein